jgi:nitrite reductase (NO-forming)
VITGTALGHPANAVAARNKAERIQAGKGLFTTMCATCHQAAGQGLTGKYPPLAASDYLNADKNQAIRVLLHGKQGDIVVNGAKYNNNMPSFPLGDEDIANALTYTYNNFGNSGKEVTPDEVKALRTEKYQPDAAATKTAPSQFE